MPRVWQLARSLEAFVIPQVPAGFHVRHFRAPTDIPAWLATRAAAFAGESLAIRPWTERDFRQEMLCAAWWRPERCWLAFAPDGTLAGSVTLAWRGRAPRGWPAVHWLFVAPCFRGQGLARSLVQHLESACWQDGFREIRLETHAAWEAALRCYLQLGYRAIR